MTPAEEIKRMAELSSAILDHGITLPNISKEELKAALIAAAGIIDQSLSVDLMRATIHNHLNPKGTRQ